MKFSNCPGCQGYFSKDNNCLKNHPKCPLHSQDHCHLPAILFCLLSRGRRPGNENKKNDCIINVVIIVITVNFITFIMINNINIITVITIIIICKEEFYFYDLSMSFNVILTLFLSSSSSSTMSTIVM